MTTVDFYSHILSAGVFALLIYVLLQQRKRLEFLQTACRSLMQQSSLRNGKKVKLAKLEDHLAATAYMCGSEFENQAGRTDQLYAMQIGPMARACIAIKPLCWRMSWHSTKTGEKSLQIDVVCGASVSDSNFNTYNNDISQAFKPAVTVNILHHGGNCEPHPSKE